MLTEYLVFILDIVMDIKFRKLFDTIYSGHAFTGSFPWVHFNVFTVSPNSAANSNTPEKGAWGFLSLTILYTYALWKKRFHGYPEGTTLPV